MVFNTMGWFVENATCANHNHGRMGYLTSVQSVLYTDAANMLLFVFKKEIVYS